MDLNFELVQQGDWFYTLGNVRQKIKIVNLLKNNSFKINLFKLRLNHHSARLDGGLSSPAECEPFSFFSSPRNVPSSKAPDNNELKSSKNILNEYDFY